MPDSQNRILGKGKYLIGFMLLLFASVACAAFGMFSSEDFDIARREVLLRRLGHEILLQSGDSTSRVPPVKKISENEYRIGFEHELTFLPGSLVNITRKVLKDHPLANDYVVKVLNTGNSSVVYGFAISENKKDDIITCIGRKQPLARYELNIEFKPTVISTAKKGYLLGSLPFLTLVGFIFLRAVKTRKALPAAQSAGVFTLGSVSFDAKNRQLTVNDKTTDLTGTENRLLLIFASSPNETIARSRLQKEIWEDEGVIVGRSLDMFISKLRKKLEGDQHIKIIVIRGKGYKLQISS
ncbi:winged helix-turn-helix domain-containing protein [Pedobacter sp.]|uniref:winged helix-turn-helix domain-containing protein n=1 Tax=Pedobacter sp. TaxID=1411316 RepID=UPI0031DA27C5